jgi:hypothetical protein
MVSKKRTNGSGEAVRVFVGTAAEDAEACAVLEYSLRAHTSLSVEIEWMRLSRDSRSPYYADPQSHAGWRTERWGTPWTALRWAVPELCGWRGRAVYFDCPQIILGDVAELWQAEFPPGAAVLARRSGAGMRTACLVWDCAAAKRWVPGLDDLQGDVGAHQRAGHILMAGRGLIGPPPAGWEVNDAEYSASPGSATGSVHCANPHLQPHQRHALSRLRRQGREHWFTGARLPHYCEGLVRLFDEQLVAAVAAGYAPEKYVPEEDYGPYTIQGADQVDVRRFI